MEIICTNDKFSADTLEFYRKFNVVIPKLNQIYSIREIRYDVGKQGLLLEGLNNPNVPINLGYKVIEIEPSWNINRFATLLGDKIEENELEYIEKITTK